MDKIEYNDSMNLPRKLQDVNFQNQNAKSVIENLFKFDFNKYNPKPVDENIRKFEDVVKNRYDTQKTVFGGNQITNQKFRSRQRPQSYAIKPIVEVQFKKDEVISGGLKEFSFQKSLSKESSQPIRKPRFQEEKKSEKQDEKSVSRSIS